MHILLLKRYGDLGPSSRVRFYQYIPYLKSNGVEVTVASLQDNDALKAKYKKQKMTLSEIGFAYIKRLLSLFKVKRFDLVWLEAELFPWAPAWFEAIIARLKVPYVVDYDDATFHRYDLNSSAFVRKFLGKKIDSVMYHAKTVVVGNDYLVARAKLAKAKQIEILPSVIDLDKYKYSSKAEDSFFNIGWVGSFSTTAYLQSIVPVIGEMCKDEKTRFILVGAEGLPLEGVNIEYRVWNEETEVANIASFDVGVMPLPDDPWANGKCGYKLIQYMGCEKPTVTSPVGINKKIVEHGVNGFHATTAEEWILALKKIRDDKEFAEKAGKHGRKQVEDHYSLQVAAPKLLKILQNAIR